MLKILDRYILKKFLTTYIFVVLLFIGVLTVIDFTEKNDQFLKYKPSFGQIIFDYYLNFIPYWANLLSPIMVFIATVFVNSQLATRTEIVAILSSGVSFFRFMRPYIIGSTLIGLLILGLVNYVIPNANKTRIAFEVKYTKKPFNYDKRNVHFRLNKEQYAYLESYNNTNNQGYLFTLERIRGTRLLEKLKAESIIWIPETKKWRLEKIQKRIFIGPKKGVYFISSLDTTLNLLPKDFENQYMLYETFTTPELNAYIEEMTLRGSENIAPYIIEGYLRITFPFAIVILTMIGVILSSKKSREGPGFQVALGFLLAFVYIVLFLFSRSLASTGNFDPLLATWMPNILFSIIGVILYNTIPK